MGTNGIAAVLGVALFTFGLAQFATVSSNAALTANLAAQGFGGFSVYLSPPFVSAFSMLFFGVIVLAFSGELAIHYGKGRTA